MKRNQMEQNLMVTGMINLTGLVYTGAAHATGLSIFDQIQNIHADRFLPKP
ncbi:hypothetical protein [Paenibacillus selenitireducens]|uniref:hypothetical protein n=1 Tax=Paenibacillus selenitireducens TaxID=1324314 RepID=UPI001301E5E5|nr:hypothetical protein [Paenibacillus selenitireducens]